jgi:hypothetical protein
MKLLIKYADNWSDEIDLEGHYVCTEEEWASYQLAIKKHFDEGGVESLHYWIGTNEEIEYESAEQVFAAFDVKKISDMDSAVLDKYGLSYAGYLGPEL